jgi:hypothetical protein
MARAKAKAAKDPEGTPPVPLLERDGMISKAELAAFLGDITEGTLDQWASRGGGPEYHIVGKHRMYWPADVKAWLATRKRRTASEPSGGQPGTSAAA